MEKENTSAAVAQTHATIHILDLGRQKKKAIKNLKNHTGKLIGEVEHAVATLPDDKNKHVIVVIYKKKRRKRSSFPCSPLSPLSLFR